MKAEVYAQIYMHVCTNACMHVQSFKYTYIQIWECMYALASMQDCMYARMCVCTYVCTIACMYKRLYVRMNECI